MEKEGDGVCWGTKVLSAPDMKIGPYLQEIYNTRQGTSCVINKKISFLQLWKEI